jgi:DNA polymerase III epsilon subunit family exonuclease
MTEDFLNEIRALPNLNRAIVRSVCLHKQEMRVEINLITDMAFTEEDENGANKIARKYVPEEFALSLTITKLTPDEGMVARKILQGLSLYNHALSSLIDEKDIKVERTEGGFYFTISVMLPTANMEDTVKNIVTYLKGQFCGEFSGKCVKSENKIEDLKVEEKPENIEYVIPIRRFNIENFNFLEGTNAISQAVYMADMNFESESVSVCGKIEDIAERKFTKGNGQEKTYYNFTLSDGTATMRATYFTRQKSIEKIKKLQVGESIVCTGRSEIYRGAVRFTANIIDYGCVPKDFVPEKRASKPAPKYYEVVKPEPFSDFTQTDFFTKNEIPDCLKGSEFVVFDLETTGLNSSPSAGNMDRIIEIGAYKIIGGEIKESFTTFINPERKLSEEIITLTGIKPEMLEGAPTYEQVMPDFFKFCQGAYLVGHNIAGFDFKFVEYYCQTLGYTLERKIFDTIPLAQELLFLSNYKLNTVADHFGITFNHHRAIDDALVTAKIFIELVKLKKSLPKPC